MIAWILRIVVLLLLVALVGAIWKREQLTRLLAVNSLFSEEKIVNNFSGMDQMFLTRTMVRGEGDVSELPQGDLAVLPNEISDYITNRSLTALLVMKDGKIVFEDYYQDTSAEDLRIGWSVSKSWLSALFGILEAEEVFDSLDDPVVDYARGLENSAYETATIRDVLQMSSGVVFDEDYLDFNSDINKMGRVLALGGSMDKFAGKIDESFATPGETWQYVSIDTHVLGMVVRGETGKSIPELLTERIINPLGLEADPYYLTDGNGVAFVLGGLNMRTRDYARFGQMIANGGNWQGQQIVPEAWIEESTVASANTLPGEIGYGYQWWIPDGSGEGQFLARGIYGQYIYIDRPRNVVIVVNAADRQFREEGVDRENEAIFRLIAESL